MKIKAFAIGLLAASSLVACQAEQETGTNQENYEGVQNTRFERLADDMYDQGNRVNQYDNDRGMVHNTNYHVAKVAADRIEKNVDGIDEAYVLKTRDNAYVAAILNNNDSDEISNEVEKAITKQVKSADQDIDNVYISTNPDFVDLTNNYVNDVENGQPVRGFFREFGQMVDRVFPEARS
ncbi:YhcN/YlaJ family sporulation lipoprotein [Halobacillus fulvus]|nr:YhcN/YlaJ family sporulation lipoprotein [Halobacillus fulvus]